MILIVERIFAKISCSAKRGNTKMTNGIIRILLIGQTDDGGGSTALPKKKGQKRSGRLNKISRICSSRPVRWAGNIKLPRMASSTFSSPAPTRTSGTFLSFLTQSPDARKLFLLRPGKRSMINRLVNFTVTQKLVRLRRSSPSRKLSSFKQRYSAISASSTFIWRLEGHWQWETNAVGQPYIIVQLMDIASLRRLLLSLVTLIIF